MNPVLLQKQLNDNASDLQDFYKDLKTWGDEMKRREESLKKGEDTAIKKPKVQAVKSSPKPKVSEVPKEKMSRIGSTDYAKWEKFDADLECERLEDDIEDDSELTDEFEETLRDEALGHKEKGNRHVKLKEWDKAIDCYTKALNCYSYDPVFYANRALCYLKKENYISAEEDCTLSLRLDSTYVKALQRRAAAREALGKLELAESDLDLVLSHEPKNKESVAALERIRKKLGVKEKPTDDSQRPVSKFTASRNKTLSTKPTITNTTVKPLISQTNIENPKIDTSVPSTSIWPDPGCEIIPVKTIKKPPHLRSKKPLKRIEIIEIDSLAKVETKQPEEPPEAFKKCVVEHVKKVNFKEEMVDSGEPVERISAFKKNREKNINQNNQKLSENAWPQASEKNDIIKSDDLKVLEKKPENNIKEVKNTENIFITKMDNKTVTDIVDIKQNEVENSSKEFSVPKTSVQFYSTWKTLKNSDDKFKFLKLIDAQEIPNIFRESLDSNVFSNILDILSTKFIENGDDVYDFLLKLTQVKRFSALTMFMDTTDKNRLWKLISYLRENNKIPQQQIDNLVLEYEL